MRLAAAPTGRDTCVAHGERVDGSVAASERARPKPRRVLVATGDPHALLVHLTQLVRKPVGWGRRRRERAAQPGVVGLRRDFVSISAIDRLNDGANRRQQRQSHGHLNLVWLREAAQRMAQRQPERMHK